MARLANALDRKIFFPPFFDGKNLPGKFFAIQRFFPLFNQSFFSPEKNCQPNHYILIDFFFCRQLLTFPIHYFVWIVVVFFLHLHSRLMKFIYFKKKKSLTWYYFTNLCHNMSMWVWVESKKKIPSLERCLVCAITEGKITKNIIIQQCMKWPCENKIRTN